MAQYPPNHYLNHQKDVETRRVQFDLQKAKDRAHILEGLKIALDNIDEIVELIKTSAYKQVAGAKLIERFGLAEIQSDAILEMRLHRLTGLERDKIENEYNQLMEVIKELEAILADENLLLAIIKENLIAIKEKYDNPRRTEMTFGVDDIDIEDFSVKNFLDIMERNGLEIAQPA